MSHSLLRPCRAAAFALFCAGSILSGCTIDLLTRDRYVSFDFNGTAVNVRCNETRNSFNLQPFLAGTNFEYRVLSARRKSNFTYALLEVWGDSAADKSGPCGKGRERNLVWLKMDATLAPVEARSALVESCLRSLQAGAADLRSESRLTVHYFNDTVVNDSGRVTPRRSDFTFQYDDEHPEPGFTVEKSEATGTAK